jgi:hypothetical protein
MNPKRVYFIAAAVVIVVIGVVGYIGWVRKQETASVRSPLPDGAAPATKPIVQDEPANWKIYSDGKLGITFKYPPQWSLNKLIDNTPYLEIRADNIGAYGLEYEDRELQKSIANETVPGIISFTNGKGLLGINCAELGQDYPLPNYTLVFFSKGKKILMNVSDLQMNLEPGAKMCSRQKATDYPYLREIDPPNMVNGIEYKVYNDFVTLIKETLVLK